MLSRSPNTDANEMLEDSPFDPQSPGTSEGEWRTALRSVPAWHPDGESLLVVSPHPDDETLGAGGVMAAALRARQTVHVLLLTDGEMSHPDDRTMGPRRIAELQRALGVLGHDDASIRLTRLQLPDGRIQGFTEDITTAIAAHLERNTVLIGPFERDGHPDHDAAGAACLAAAARCNVRAYRYPVWAWHHRRIDELMGLSLVRVDLDAWQQARKAQATRCFQSQLRTSSSWAPPIVPEHVLQYFQRPFEIFVS